MNAALIYEICRACAASASVNRGLEPVAAIREPPACVADGDRRGQRPPQRKRHVSNEAEYAEGDPKYFPLHMSILDASEQVMSHCRAKMFQIEMLPGPAIPMIPKRMRNES
jgi:hypothetical protein